MILNVLVWNGVNVVGSPVGEGGVVLGHVDEDLRLQHAG